MLEISDSLIHESKCRPFVELGSGFVAASMSIAMDWACAYVYVSAMTPPTVPIKLYAVILYASRLWAWYIFHQGLHNFFGLC